MLPPIGAMVQASMYKTFVVLAQKTQGNDGMFEQASSSHPSNYISRDRLLSPFRSTEWGSQEHMKEEKALTR